MTAPADHDAYLAPLPADRAARLAALRARINARLPDAVEVISYAMPGFRMPNGKVILGYAAWKAHYALYPHSGTALSAVGPAPEGLTIDRGTLRAPWDRDIPDAVLDAVIAARRAEIGA
ncbi:iron chaperone [Pseudooceanicola sp. LIPI14-2-Ac024]|uniref:iron chaperone n=1 Tax=Pseudooceanicola sp. LIPI14-2-Ac024 TaxID=3344875 RepID=UPI0035D06652